MKKQYDFSNGVKGKFYIPESEIELPVYLNADNQKYYLEIANEKKIAMSSLINEVLSREIELMNILVPK